MLTLLEEVVLLAVDENTGELRSASECGTTYALAAAVLFDLALAGRIDTGTEEVTIVDGAPTGNVTLDRILSELSSRTDLATVRSWIEELVARRDDLEGEALQSLAAQGILRHERTKRLWIIDVERFPLVDAKPQEHVKVRLARAILTDEIPDTRDIMLVSLAEACGMLGCVASEEELAGRKERIHTLCNLETISRKVAAAIGDLESMMHQPITKVV